MLLAKPFYQWREHSRTVGAGYTSPSLDEPKAANTLISSNRLNAGSSMTLEKEEKGGAESNATRAERFVREVANNEEV